MSKSGDFIYEVDPSWTLFLDRDGVVNERLPGTYVKHVSEFDILPGVLEALYIFQSVFLRIFVVSNQQGVGKGYMTHGDVDLVHAYLIHEVENAHAHIDQIYYSPDLAHLPSQTRKPQIGMALQAKSDFPEIDLKKAIMVGDSLSDMQFGKNAGMKTVLVGEKGDLIPRELIDIQSKDLYAFCLLLSSHRQKD